jgi:hypothetical protein
MGEVRRLPKIRLTVVGPEYRADYVMPWTERPVEAFGGLPADMLDGATLFVGGATSLPPDAVVVPAVVVEPVNTSQPKQRVRKR